MNIFEMRSISRAAQQDAASDINSIDDRVIAEKGPQRRLDPVENSEHAKHVRTLAKNAEEGELQEDVAAAERAASEAGAPFLYTLGVLVAVAVETLAATWVMDNVGVPTAERLPLSLGLALCTIGLTAVVAHRMTDRDAREDEKGALSTIRRGTATLVLFLIYTAAALAIAFVRVENSLDEETSPLGIVSRTVVMLLVTMGLGWMTDFCVRKRIPAAEAYDRVRSIRRRLRDLRRDRRRAQSFVDEVSRDRERWSKETARLRAKYALEHRLAEAQAKAQKEEAS